MTPTPPPTDSDAAAADSAMADSAMADSAVLDSAVADSAVLDSAVLDSAVLDSAVLDSAVLDSAVADSAILDSAVLDGGTADTGSGLGCTAAELCVAGRCVPRCTADSDCLAAEMCDSDGLCVARTGPRVDASLPDAEVDAAPDADPPMPCDGVSCDTPGLSVCHAASGECVQCQDSTMCGGGVPVCDIARGGCTAFAAIDCAPCNNDFDCAGLPGTCVDLDDPVERVCLPSCAMGEPCRQGLSCDAVMGVCVPTAGTCTAFFAATRARPCASDAECVPHGEMPTPGMCEGADASMMIMGVCRQPCAGDDQCPAGLTCPAADFCRP